MRVWRKFAAALDEESWLSRLADVEPERIVITIGVGVRIRVEVYGVSQNEADRLRRKFGGRILDINLQAILRDNVTPGRPIFIRDQLIVVRSERERKKWTAKFPRRAIVVVPAGVAFGTGDHATTASCLRLLCDAAAARGGAWDFLDIGTGTGILAIAAKMLGAQRVDAMDFDRTAVRVARETAAINSVRGIQFKCVDVTQWHPNRTWQIVASNVYSDVLIASASQIANSVAEGGALILSGILRTQESDCVAAFLKHGLEIQRTVRRGKWIALLVTNF